MGAYMIGGGPAVLVVGWTLVQGPAGGWFVVVDPDESSRGWLFSSVHLPAREVTGLEPSEPPAWAMF